MPRAISAAGDRERSGALDVEWEGARATFVFMFGHPSHLVFEAADGRKLDGADALDALVEELPSDFRVAPWRRAMVTDETLHSSAEDLRGTVRATCRRRFQRTLRRARHGGGRRAGRRTPTRLRGCAAGGAGAVASHPAPPFGFNDFPLLPLGTVLWSDAVSNVVDLEAVVPHLPESLLVLEGPTCRAAALIAGGAIVDAVWVNATGGLLGEEAARALMSTTEGTLTAHRIDDPRLVSAVRMLWRGPRVAAGLPSAWLRTDEIVAEVRASGRSCGLLVDSADPGAALFDRGELVAVYTAEHRWPATSKAALRSLLHAPGALVQVIGQPGPYATAGELGEEPPMLEDPVADPETQAAPDEAVAAVRSTDDAMADTDGLAPIEPSSNGAGVSMNGASPASAVDEPAPADDDPASAEDSQPSSQPAAEPAAGHMYFEPAVFSIASLSPKSSPEPMAMEQVEAREAMEFVPARLDIDVDALRSELTAIAVEWLGADDSVPVATAISGARAGVDDFVAAITAIGAMEIPGHETAVVRAMAREMHFRATEVLCGV